MSMLEVTPTPVDQRPSAGLLPNLWRPTPRRALRMKFLWGDLVAVTAAAALSGIDVVWATAVGVLLIVANASAKLYRRRLSLSWGRDTPRGLAAAAIVLGLLVAVAVALRSDGDTIAGLVRCVALAVVLLGALRAVLMLLARWSRRRGRRERVLVVGASPTGVDLVKVMQRYPQYGLEPVGFVDGSPPIPGVVLPVPVVGSDLATAVYENDIHTVVLAFSGVRDAQVIDTAITAHQLGTTIFAVPRLFEMYHDGVDVERLRSYPLTRLTPLPTHRPTWKLKRVFDIAVAGLGLLLASPVLAVVAAAVLLESGRPILFRQTRTGKDSRAFDVLKVRSMRPANETESQTQWSVVGDPRVGPVGRLLRRTSLDELPQLWNIVRGDMSLVGPRPERPGFVQEFSVMHDRYWARHRVPAGLTGLAQVNGLRGDTSIAERARYDNYYIANWSLWLDLQILFLTVRELFRRGQH